MTWFLRVHGKTLCTGILLRSSRRLMLLSHHECQQPHTEKRLWPSSTSRRLHSAKAPETSWISYSSTIQKYTGSPISSERMPGLVSTATQFPFKEKLQDTQRKRSHFNFIELLRVPFSEVQHQPRGNSRWSNMSYYKHTYTQWLLISCTSSVWVYLAVGRLFHCTSMEISIVSHLQSSQTVSRNSILRSMKMHAC